MNRVVVVVLPLLLFAGVAQGHVSVSPIESAPGKTETYNFNVPTEGQSATVAVELEVPAEMTIISVKGSPTEYTVAKSGERIVGVTWRVNIPSGSSQQLTLVARNPTTPSFGVQWKVHQRFADGSSADWIEPPPTRPAPRTRILPK
jgi:uncharacterized protein YcnI